VVDDSSTDVVSFKIDNEKRQLAQTLVVEFEQKVKDGKLNSESVLQGVNMEDVFADLRTMLDYPNSTIIGNSGHYCSVAVVLNWLLNNQPEKYAKAVLELAFYGHTSFGEGGKIKVPKVLRKKVDYSIIDTVNYKTIRKDIDATSISDFLLGVSLLHAEKGLQKVGLLHPKATYKKTCIGSFIFSNTAPWEMDDLFKKVGVSIEKKGFYLGDKETLDELLMIERAVKEGKMPVIFDNHWISYAQGKNFLYEFTGAHFINLHSFKIDKENNIISYSYWDYGRVKNNPYLTRTIKSKLANTISRTIKKSERFKKKKIVQKRSITIEEFLKAMKGYWIPK